MPSPAKRTSRKKTTAPVSTISMPSEAAPRVPQHEIERLAFEFYCARGGQHGSDLEDWLRAERELLQGGSKRQ